MIGSVSGACQSSGSSAVSGVHHHHRPHGGGQAMQPAADPFDVSQPAGGIDAPAANVAGAASPPPSDASASNQTPTAGSTLLTQVSQLLGVSADQLLDQLVQQQSSANPSVYGVSASIFGGIKVDTQA